MKLRPCSFLGLLLTAPTPAPHLEKLPKTKVGSDGKNGGRGEENDILSSCNVFLNFFWAILQFNAFSPHSNYLQVNF